jgi:hypothetical protein
MTHKKEKILFVHICGYKMSQVKHSEIQYNLLGQSAASVG